MPIHCILWHYLRAAFLREAVARSERAYKLNTALPLHAAFTQPLRAATACMNRTMEDIIINKLFLSIAQASRRLFPLQSGANNVGVTPKYSMPKYTMQMNWHYTVFWH